MSEDLCPSCGKMTWMTWMTWLPDWTGRQCSECGYIEDDDEDEKEEDK